MDKIFFTVYCDETKKKYRISFKQQIYEHVTIRHIRDHVKRVL